MFSFQNLFPKQNIFWKFIIENYIRKNDIEINPSINYVCGKRTYRNVICRHWTESRYFVFSSFDRITHLKIILYLETFRNCGKLKKVTNNGNKFQEMFHFLISLIKEATHLDNLLLLFHVLLVCKPNCFICKEKMIHFKDQNLIFTTKKKFTIFSCEFYVNFTVNWKNTHAISLVLNYFKDVSNMKIIVCSYSYIRTML